LFRPMRSFDEIELLKSVP